MFNVAKVYTFNNEALENIALNPSYVKGLKHVSSRSTFSREVCLTSYCYSKARAYSLM